MIPGERHMECAYYFDFCRLCPEFRCYAGHVVERNQNDYNTRVLTCAATPKTDLVLTISA